MLDGVKDGLHAAGPAGSARPQPRPWVAEPPLMAPRRVLIVDDNAAARRLLRIACEVHGAEVEDCADGKAAEAVLALRRFDLILLDCHMPVMDGRMLAQRVRAAGHPGRLVAATADALLPFSDPQGMRVFDGVLIKPIPMDTIRAELAGLPARRAAVAYVRR
jgi:CheY-like chemotaxis protein